MRLLRILSSLFSPQTKEALKQEWIASQRKELESVFKLVEQTILDKQKSELEEIRTSHLKACEELSSVIESKLSFLKRDEQDLDDFLQRIADRKVELEKVSQELKEQLRLIEAKASPSSMWAEVFTAGFNKAWDMMLPVMTGGIENMKQIIHDRAVDETLDGLEKHIQERALKLNGNSIR